MKKKYFLVSDIHSFYEPMMKALKDAGFDETNKRHILCVLGDVFDRGSETWKVYNFLKGLPKGRLILIRGNHEDLYEELLEKDFPQSHDFHNGTVKTFCQIADLGITDADIRSGFIPHNGTFWGYDEILPETQKEWDVVLEAVKKSEITKWIKKKSLWKDYCEIGKYILVHSFIPLNLKKDIPPEVRWFIKNDASSLEYDPNWREAKDWREARWGNPIALYSEGLLKEENRNGKVLICGHWHSFGFREVLDGVRYKDKSEIDFSIYYSKDIVAIDACTALSGICNVMAFDSAEGDM